MIAALLLIACVAVPAFAQDLPTMQTLQALQAEKKWPELSQAASRVLLLKGEPAKAYDRGVVWVMKGEAQLNLRQFVPASDSFLSAANEPGFEAASADKAFATSMLVRKSDARGFKVAPSKTDNRSPQMPILDERDREAALLALFDNELADAKKDAEKAKTMALVARFVKQAQPTRRIERGATGQDAKVNELCDAAVNRVAESARQWTDESAARVADIEKQAGEQVMVRDEAGNARVAVRGVTPEQAKELKDIVKGCENFAKEYGRLADVLEAQPPVLRDLPPAIERLHDRVKRAASPSYRPGP